MAQYFTNFNKYTTNQKPSEWTERWSTESNNFITIENPSAVGGKWLENVSSYNGVEFLSWDIVGESADTEIVALIMQTANSYGQCHLILRANPEEQQGYSVRFNADSRILIRNHKAGADTTIETINYSWQINKWYWMRFRVQGSELKIKVWEKGLDEPIEWLREMTDASIQGTGLCGVGKWNNTGARYFDIVGVGTDGDTAPMEEVKRSYSPIGRYTTMPIQTSGAYRINWLENKPTGTNIIIEYATGVTQGEWIEISNGDVIISDTNLWFRVTLETTDTSVTPTLQDLWIEEPDAPQDGILITMDWLGRFNNVEGELTVNYDAVKGSLSGRGGAVESFTETFTPTDLVPKPNPGVAETIVNIPSINTAFTKVTYNNRHASDCIVAKNPSIAVVFTNVAEVNP